MMVTTTDKRKREKKISPAKGTSIAVRGDVNNSNIITGSNNIIHMLERAASVVELTEQADQLEQGHLKRALVEYVNKIKLQAELAEKGLDTKSPYKALLEYEITDSSLFFGRDTYIAELLDCIKRNSLTVLHSESGAGKSSLLRAGIGPHLLTEGSLPLYVRPREMPALQTVIKHALLPQLEQSPNLANASLRDFLRRVSKLLGKKWMVIIVDQFEEIFTLQSEEARMAFVKELAECLDDKTLPVRWILSLRGEWFSQLAKFQPMIRNPFENSVFLSAFNKADAYEVIIKPALKRGIRYENGLVERIVTDLISKNENKPNLFASFSNLPKGNQQEEEISPPQLQLVCSEIFKKTDKNTRLITTEMYRVLGGAETILQNYLDRVIDENIPKEHVELAEKILVALVDNEGHRILRSRNQIQLELGFKVIVENLDKVLKQLADSHLLRVEEEDEYELAHDYLANKIRLDPETQKQKFAKELLEQKVKYFNRGGIKLSSDELTLVEEYLPAIELSNDEAMLIHSSKQDTLRRRYLSVMGYMTVFGAGISLFVITIIFLVRGVSVVAPQGYVALFWGGIFLMGLIGATRGWVKELLVSFSLILAIAINKLIMFIPLVRNLGEDNPSLFWIRLVITLTLAFFGYQVVTAVPLLSGKANRERLQDSLFGVTMGGINGYLLVGSIWYYLHVMGYTPLEFSPPIPGTLAGDSALLAINYLPQSLMGGVGIFIAVVLVLIFVVFVVI